MLIGIFYGSSSGHTEDAAELLAGELGLGQNDVYDIADTDIDAFDDYDVLIFMSSSTGTGNMQPDWADLRGDLEDADFSDKTAAFAGMGDQMMFTDSFLGGISRLYGIVAKKAERIIGGNWPSDGYEFEHSNFFRKGTFRGLALDDDNQPELTEPRIRKWAEQLKKELGKT